MLFAFGGFLLPLMISVSCAVPASTPFLLYSWIVIFSSWNAFSSVRRSLLVTMKDGIDFFVTPVSVIPFCGVPRVI